MSGNAHQKKVVRKAVEAALAKVGVPTSTVPNLGTPRTVNTELLVTIILGVLALIGVLLQLNGVVTLRWIFSAPIYALLTASAVYAFWKWEGICQWSGKKRIVSVVLLGIIFAAVSSVGVVTQYQREHATPSVPQSAGFIQLQQYGFFKDAAPYSARFNIYLVDVGAPVKAHYYYQVYLRDAEPDQRGLLAEKHKSFLADALDWDRQWSEKGIPDKYFQVGERVWQTWNFSDEETKAVAEGKVRLYFYAWARWKEGTDDLDEMSLAAADAIAKYADESSYLACLLGPAIVKIRLCR